MSSQIIATRPGPSTAARIVEALHPREDLERLLIGDELEAIVGHGVAPLVLFGPRDAVRRSVGVLDVDLVFAAPLNAAIPDLVADGARVFETALEVLFEPRVVHVVGGIDVAAVFEVRS